MHIKEVGPELAEPPVKFEILLTKVERRLLRGELDKLSKRFNGSASEDQNVPLTYDLVEGLMD